MFCIKNYLSPRCVIFVVQLCISAIYMDNGLCFFRKIVELFADKQCTESYIAFAAKQFAKRFAFSAQFSAGGYKNIVRCKVRIAPVIFVLAHQNVFFHECRNFFHFVIIGRKKSYSLIVAPKVRNIFCKSPFIFIALVKQYHYFQFVIAVECNQLQNNGLHKIICCCFFSVKTDCGILRKRQTYRHIMQNLRLFCQSKHGILKNIIIHRELFFGILYFRIHFNCSDSKTQL